MKINNTTCLSRTADTGWPLEVATGIDAVALEKKYGENLTLVDNIDKQVFHRGKSAIHDEVMSKVPYLTET